MTAPFGRRLAPVRERRVVGRYVVLAVEDELGRAEPGQFYMLAAARRWGGGEGERPYLGRAVSVMRVRDGDLVEFLLEDVGPGTKRLCELDAGEEMAIVGPFGRGFSEPPGGELLLVGGGIGIAPLVFVQERWGGRPLLGFRDADHAVAASLFSDPVVATDDGSRGRRGLVTDLLDSRAAAPARIYACGPDPMLAAVGERARRREVPCELAVESPMACGFGACWGCVVATVDGYKRACVDGPVFDGAVLIA